MLSRNANYDMDDALLELNKAKDVLNLRVEVQTILQLLVIKGIVTREEVSEMRRKVKNSNIYKPLYQQADDLERQIMAYKDNPEQHLKDLFNAKINGTIK